MTSEKKAKQRNYIKFCVELGKTPEMEVRERLFIAGTRDFQMEGLPVKMKRDAVDRALWTIRA